MGTDTMEHTNAEPMSPAERARGAVACALSVLKGKFSGVITTARALSEREATETGAHWIADVYFVPSSRLMEFEDFVDDLAITLSEESGATVLIISHTEEATEQYYLETLQQCCPFDLENRGLGGGVTIAPPFMMLETPPSWFLAESTVMADIAWTELQRPSGQNIRKAA